ncbi:MAG TPA: P-loop NTPase [Fibrobacteria bacterium]|nr:P-loop NTPase [Fibrobacteria bacterium]
MATDIPPNAMNPTHPVSPVLKQILALRRKAEENLRNVRRKLVVTGGKGGVGKSSITANLAAVLTKDGFKVGVLDADVQGASLARMLGMTDSASSMPSGRGFQGIQVVSMGTCFGQREGSRGALPELRADSAWQSAFDAGIVREFIVESNWGELDFLLIDTPPASWEILAALSGLIPDLEGCLMVTQPADAARNLLGRSISICDSLNVPVLGIVENMAPWECPHCGRDVPLFDGSGTGPDMPAPWPLLGSIPFDPRMGIVSPEEGPFVARYPESPAGKALAALALSLARLENEKRAALESL